MALDYGRKRVGIAITDELQMIANPLETIDTHKLPAYLDKFFEMEKIELLVIGEPKQMDYTTSESEKYILPFIQQLKKKYPDLKIIRHDERFTSKMAFQTLLDAGLIKKDRQDKSKLDSISAAIILQSYMSGQNHKR